MRIGVFDSGVGGLSILEAIQQVLPDASYAYCCDNENFPYGTKTEPAVIDCASQVTTRFHQAAKLDILVIACNTASTVALDKIRAGLPIPVVGVVPAIKPAAERSKSKVIGVLATPATVSRPYLDKLIHEFASDCKVIKCGSSGLVILAEQKLRGTHIKIDDVCSEIIPILDAISLGLDKLVLGCTHFPLLAEELTSLLPPSVELIDSGKAIAARVRSLVEQSCSQIGQPKTSSADKLSGWCSGAAHAVSLPNQRGKLILQTLP